MKILGTNFRTYDEEAQRNKHRPFFRNVAESYVSFFVPSKLDAQQKYGDWILQEQKKAVFEDN